jgi:hypothetical protein|tara:strand:- start:4 stop:120 length:117 start_codon:yes stop_codon:yes gene_type:complete
MLFDLKSANSVGENPKEDLLKKRALLLKKRWNCAIKKL